MPIALTADTLPAYLLRLGEVTPLDPSAAINVAEITDGNLNFAFAVTQPTGAAVFVKQAPPYIKCLGPAHALEERRLLLESAALAEFNRLAPQYVPAIFHVDADNCVMVVQLLSGYELMRTALRAGSCRPRHATEVAAFMAETHRKTTHPAGSPERLALEERFANPIMCGITAEYVFSKPLDALDPTNRCSGGGVAADAAALRADEALRAEVAALRALFLSERECLLHGDLHTGSVMVPLPAEGGGAEGGGAEGGGARGGAAQIIDAEFVFCGPAAFDVGIFLANLVFAFLSHAARRDVQLELLQMIRDAYAAYAGEEATPAGDGGARQLLLQRATGFAGCELIRRVIGAAHVDDLELLDEAGGVKARAESAALRIGAQLVKARGAYCGIEDVVAAVEG